MTVLILFSAFFSSLETGLLSLGEIKIREWSKDKIKPLKIWLEQPTNVITGILVGNNFVNIVFSSLFTILVVKLIAQRQEWVSFTETISIIGSSFLILIMGEIIPKTFANINPDKIVGLFYKPFVRYYIITKRIIGFLNKTAFSMIRIMSLEKEKKISRHELHIALEEVEKHGLIEKDSSGMFEGILFLADRSVRQIMKPAREIYGIDLNWNYNKIMDKIITSKYSRIPAYKNGINNIKGFIYIKDVIRELNRKRKFDFDKILRMPLLSNSSDTCLQLFQKLREKRIHSAIVTKKNKVLGIVTIEDIIEEIVGEIYDEYDFMGSNN
ncbi:MAG: hemolysin family protein [Elusimicrobiota bacterium]